MQIQKNMAKTLKFMYAMILFIYIVLVTKNTKGHPSFHFFMKIPSLVFISYIIYYLNLVTSFYYVFPLQHILLVKQLLIVQKAGIEFIGVRITFVGIQKRYNG